MIEVRDYAFAKSLEDARALLASQKGAVIIGGGTFIRLSSKKIGLAVDLSKAGLEFIQETEHFFEIGAMTTLRALETHEALNRSFDNIFAKATGLIVGVQFRNMATLGGTVFGRYAFSDLIAALMSLACTVVLYPEGEMPLEKFLLSSRQGQGILEKVRIQKTPLKASYQAFRNTAGSLPILTVAATRSPSGFRIAVGSRPGQPVLAIKAMEYLNKPGGILVSGSGDIVLAARRSASLAAEEIVFADDTRASGNYRTLLGAALVERAVLEVLG